ncbi:eukaryotic translation initiation factor 3 subunit E-like [Gigantopelta aegis]|uniref:eukaryotic translation initiation factor 3 subunit E-like n=1 Tax=Gigantopelta aegis TaxID=1735272 RepID=UPI001B888573|nr:eukaryotic translation initiation factor 3 subunit E-like [Gigantopelta aegis]
MKLSMILVVLLGVFLVCSEASRGRWWSWHWRHHGRRNRRCQNRIQKLKSELDCLKTRLNDCRSRTTTTTTTTAAPTTTPTTETPTTKPRK